MRRPRSLLATRRKRSCSLIVRKFSRDHTACKTRVFENSIRTFVAQDRIGSRKIMCTYEGEGRGKEKNVITTLNLTMVRCFLIGLVTKKKKKKRTEKKKQKLIKLKNCMKIFPLENILHVQNVRFVGQRSVRKISSIFACSHERLRNTNFISNYYHESCK